MLLLFIFWVYLAQVLSISTESWRACEFEFCFIRRTLRFIVDTYRYTVSILYTCIFTWFSYLFYDTSIYLWLYLLFVFSSRLCIDTMFVYFLVLVSILLVVLLSLISRRYTYVLVDILDITLFCVYFPYIPGLIPY